MNKNSGIQGLRAIAAFLVVLQHAIYFACTAKGVNYVPYLPLGFGQIGVSIFFVISGYVMTLCLPQGRMFLVQRIARIYPAYWGAVILSLISLPLWVRPWKMDAWSMFLLPTTTFNESYGVPYWTLIFEMAFYAVMYVLALFGISEKRGASILLVWGVAIAFLCQLQIHPDFSNIDRMPFAGWWIFVSPENLMFIAGAIYGLVGQDRFKRTSPLSLGIHAGTLFFISETLPMPPYVRFLTWGVAYLCLLDLARRVRFPAFMERAGDYSYGIYLTQTILINSAMAAMLILAPHAALASYVAIALIAPVVGGLFFGAMEFHFHARAIKPVLRHL